MCDLKFLFPSAKHQLGFSLRSLNSEKGQCLLFFCASSPTFSGSILVSVRQWGKERKQERCFSFYLEAELQFSIDYDCFSCYYHPSSDALLGAGAQISALPMGYMCFGRPCWIMVNIFLWLEDTSNWLQSEWPSSKNPQTINAGDGVERRECFCTAGGNINW